MPARCPNAVETGSTHEPRISVELLKQSHVRVLAQEACLPGLVLAVAQARDTHQHRLTPASAKPPSERQQELGRFQDIALDKDIW